MNWLNTLSPGAASFVGSLTGASVGLLALLLGALFNAQLNRNRDNRLRKEDTRAVAAALKAELAGIEHTLLKNAENLDKPTGGAFYVPDLAHSVRVMPHLIIKLGLFDVETVRAIIDAYVVVDQYCEALIMMGGKLDTNMPEHRRVILMDPKSTPRVATFNRNTSTRFQNVIKRLNQYLV